METAKQDRKLLLELRVWRRNSFPTSHRDVRLRDFDWKLVTPDLLKALLVVVFVGFWICNINKHWNDDPTGLMPNATLALDGSGRYTPAYQIL
ncbi:hypothetical protein ACLOJK_026263 [Asimina triloba]